MEFIPQTNRTLLCEEINPNLIDSEGNALDLVTFLSEVTNKIPEKTYFEIFNKFLVYSIDDFFKKFKPTLYYTAIMDESGPKIVYSLKKPEDCDEVNEIILDKDHQVIQMLFSLIDSKSKTDYEFNFKDILKKLSPEYLAENAKMDRKAIDFLWNKYQKEPDKSRKKAELGAQIDQYRDKITQVYKNFPSLLALRIEDIKAKYLSFNSTDSGQKQLENLPKGKLTFKDDGSLEYIPIETSSNLLLIENNQDDSLRQLLIEDYRYENPGETHNPYIENMIADIYAPNRNIQAIEENKIQEINNYNIFIQTLAKEKESLIETALPLLQTIIGIKLFFDQHQAKSPKMQPSLLITNCTIQSILKKSDKFKVFVDKCNNTPGDRDHCLWFSIVPQVEFGKTEKVKSRPGSLGGITTKKSKNFVSDDELLQYLEIMSEFKIQTFFNETPKMENTYEYFSKQHYENMINRTKFIWENKKNVSEYAIECAPNFIIIPDDKSDFVIGRLYSTDKDDIIETVDVRLGGVYCAAAYVAAGLSAAIQDPGHLAEIFNKVNMEIPGIRVNIEEKKEKLHTSFTSSGTGYTIDLLNFISDKCYGFIFSPNKLKNTDSKFNVLLTRSLKKFQINEFEPIYRTTVSTFILKILEDNNNSSKTTFENCSLWREENLTTMKDDEETKKINQLKLLDDINFKEEDGKCIIKLTLNSLPKEMTMEITK